jgi:hypothetical protein
VHRHNEEGWAARELTKDLEQRPGTRGDTRSKKAALKAEGISKKRASECERVLRSKQDGTLATYVKECRERGEMPNRSGSITRARVADGVLAWPDDTQAHESSSRDSDLESASLGGSSTCMASSSA